MHLMNWIITVWILINIGLEATLLDLLHTDAETGHVKCMVCGYLAQKHQRRDVRRHIEAKHIRMQLICKYCGKNNSTRRAFEIHLRNHHPDLITETRSMMSIVNWHVKDVEFDVVYQWKSCPKIMWGIFHQKKISVKLVSRVFFCWDIFFYFSAC